MRLESARLAIVVAATVLWLSSTTYREHVSARQEANAGARVWPAITQETRPWTRWWWQGSAVEPRR